MNPRLHPLLTRLQADGFAALRGARAGISLPLPDALLTEAVGALLPASAPVRDVQLAAKAGHRILVRFRIASAPFLPPVNVTLVIAEQPQLPAGVLILRLETPGLLSMAGSALRFVDALPPGLQVSGDAIRVDLPALLEARGLGSLVPLLEHLEVTTIEGALVIAATLAVRG